MPLQLQKTTGNDVADGTENNSANPQILVVENQRINPRKEPELIIELILMHQRSLVVF